MEQVFQEAGSLTRLIRLSGGHVRSLFLMLTGCLQRAKGELPIPSDVVETTIRTSARDFAKGLRSSDWELVQRVREDHAKHDEDDAWYELLKNFDVLAYEDDEGEWYDAHPLLVPERVRPPDRP